MDAQNLPAREFDDNGNLLLASWKLKPTLLKDVSPVDSERLEIEGDRDSIWKLKELLGLLWCTNSTPEEKGTLVWIPKQEAKWEPPKQCSWCNKVFEQEDERIETWTRTESVTLCRACYNKAGNKVR